MPSQPETPQDRRAAALTRLAADVWDVLVIGGGIVGAGVARDAAMRGLRTALIDQQDFAAGTSGRSSRLLHGGIRYLAQGRLGLVREASREKAVLARVAPHLCQPLPFLFPTRRRSTWSRWKLSIGVKLYDLLCGIGKSLGRSSSLSADAILKILPGLSTERLTGAVRYFDGLTNDARLVLDTLRSAARHDATVCNHVRFAAAAEHDGTWQCELSDAETQQTITVRTRTIVNATGPWSDRLSHSRTSLRLTKGVHLVVDRQRLAVPEAVVMVEGQRILFAIPWGERVILGTTDTDYDGELAHPRCDAADAAYVLDVVNLTFPAARLTASDVLSTWAGLRPLVADPHGRPSDISRRHEIAMSEPGWWDVTGGKLTTYRLMAEETIDAVARRLGAGDRRSTTGDEPLVDAAEAEQISGVIPPPPSAALVQHFCRAEWACHLDDVMIRRTSWRHYRRDHLELAEQVARWMAPELGWSEDVLHRELEPYRAAAGDALAS